LDRIVGSRDTKHFKINFAFCEALETILLIWGRKLRWLSYKTPRPVAETEIKNSPVQIKRHLNGLHDGLMCKICKLVMLCTMMLTVESCALLEERVVFTRLKDVATQSKAVAHLVS